MKASLENFLLVIFYLKMCENPENDLVLGETGRIFL